MKPFFFVSCLILLVIVAPAQVPQVSAGSIKQVENFPSKFVTARNVDVWLPHGYNAVKKYAVLYMHDGQMLFDNSINWNKQEWEVDETVNRLVKEQKIKDCIVVAIWNTGTGRHADYLPQKPFETLTRKQQDSVYFSSRTNGAGIFNGIKIHSDNYLKFLVKEVKPFIDSNFSTLKDRANTFIAGSSMGGLISLYAICEYPAVFGGAACISTHWPGVFTTVNNPLPAVFLKYLKLHLPSPVNHKIYFDYGDATLDSMYKPYQQKADAIMKQKGFNKNNWHTEFFPGANHSEGAWRERFDIPVLFLLGKQ
ncbi:MAG: alpha/beta hydrolase [Chitinophagaceae bacterium]|nr:alpha/beta hydrolase [Chitinophagaceae bacterium]